MKAAAPKTLHRAAQALATADLERRQAAADADLGENELLLSMHALVVDRFDD